MKSQKAVNEARERVVEEISKKGLHSLQRAVLCGMSAALCWVAEEGGITLQRLLDGESFAKKTEQEIEQVMADGERRLEQILSEGVYSSEQGCS